MTKLHEVLAAEDTVVQGSKKMIAETTAKFGKITELFTGSVRTLRRLQEGAGEKAIEAAHRKDKALPTSVPETLDYIWPIVANGLRVKLAKHLANQVAKADVVLAGKVVLAGAPVDFLLDLERALPEWRAMFIAMPTLDPSRDWKPEGRRGVYKLAEPVDSAQTEKIMYPVVLHEATTEHPAQVKEATKDVVVGLFSDMIFSGAATTLQKAQAIKLCEDLLVAVKQARMRANNTEVPKAEGADSILEEFKNIFK